MRRLAIFSLLMMLAGTASAGDNGMLMGVSGGGAGGGGCSNSLDFSQACNSGNLGVIL